MKGNNGAHKAITVAQVDNNPIVRGKDKDKIVIVLISVGHNKVNDKLGNTKIAPLPHVTSKMWHNLVSSQHNNSHALNNNSVRLNVHRVKIVIPDNHVMN